jgi:formate hydrogenlyase transcriptional activator
MATSVKEIERHYMSGVIESFGQATDCLQAAQARRGFEGIIGDSGALRSVLEQVEIVANTASTVLIQGETRTGKELIARAIHDLSSRRNRPLIKINCAAIPTGLLESELFGNEKGAYTGATGQRIGRFESAHHGTIFLDEVGDISLELQAKLLRVLQEQEFERLGSSRTIKVDVRVIAATNCDLGEMLVEKKFRSDLYYRLNVFPIAMPALRERPGDIPLLARFFVDKYSQRMKKGIEQIGEETMAALVRLPLAGNVRELENVIERAVILSKGPELEVPPGQFKLPEGAATSAVEASTLEDVARKHILRVLGDVNW